ncbi:MAG TPA: PDZ domain-containing protein [Xanthomonadales bacterium]|nr:PDZ domain-containing protein [Xanthomonadales bacterium]
MIRHRADPDYSHGRVLFAVLALLTASWALMGWFDLPFQVRAGFDTDGQHVVSRVEPGSPAAVAGLLAGDTITHFNSVPASDAAALARRPRNKPGDTSIIGIERGGEPGRLTIRYVPLPERNLFLARAATIVGYCFLLLPLAACLRRPNVTTTVLAVMGTGLSLAFFTGPHIADFTLRAMSVAITSLFVLTGVAALLHFLLTFPQRRPLLGRPVVRRLLYLPAFFLWLLIAWRALFTPPASSALNALTHWMAGAVIGGYLLVSLFLLLRNFSRTHKAQRKALGLNWMLLATIAGIVPVTIAQLVRAFSPIAALPGQDFYFISLGLIPLGWSWSASRSPVT